VTADTKLPRASRQTSVRTSPRTWRSLVIPATIAFLVLIGLGTWQLQRKTWKEGLIAALDAQLAAAAMPLPAASTWRHLDVSRLQYHRVTFTAQFDNANEALVYATPSAFRPDVFGPDASSPGYWVFTPAHLADCSTVLVNRGFVPEGRQDPSTRQQGQLAGPITIVGALRWPDARHWFTPNDEPAQNLWFTADPTAIAAAKGVGPVAPFYVEQESPVPPGGLPHPGKLVVTLPDNHLQYALTWYGLALVLAVMFVSWALGNRRENSGKAGNAGPQRGVSPSL
jgi:surfeit locus 1 family protein